MTFPYIKKCSPKARFLSNRTDFIPWPDHSRIQIKKNSELISIVLFRPADIYKVINIIEQYWRIRGTQGKVCITPIGSLSYLLVVRGIYKMKGHNFYYLTLNKSVLSSVLRLVFCIHPTLYYNSMPGFRL